MMDQETDRAGWIAGGALGILLGIIVGISAGEHITAIVAGGLVALLAGLFGLSGKIAIGKWTAGAHRVTAFSVAAVFSLLIAMWVRTHDVFGPSFAEQRQILREIGFPDGSPQQREMLLHLRFGTRISGNASGASSSAHRASMLDAITPAGFCAQLMMSGATTDLLTLLDNAGEAKLREIATRIRALPREKQAPALDYARIFLCEGG